MLLRRQLGIVACAFASLGGSLAHAQEGPRLTYESIGVTFEVPSTDWRFLPGEDGNSGPLVKSPGGNLQLMIQLVPVDSCAAEVAKKTGEGHAKISRPSYLPATFHADTTKTTEGSTEIAMVCWPAPKGGVAFVIASVVPLTSVGDLGTVLDSIARAVAEKYGAAYGEPDPPSSTPVPIASESTSSAADSSSDTDPSPSSESYDPPYEEPYEPEVEEIARKPPNRWVPRVLLEGRFGVLQSSGVEDAMGGAFGLRLTEGLIDSRHVDLFLEAEGTVGYNAPGNLMGSAQGGAGLGINFWRLGLIPVAGAGFDSISGGDAASFKLPMGGLYYFGGYLTIGVAPPFSMFGRALRVNRLVDVIPHETRVLAGFDLWFKGPLTYELAFQWIDYGDAQSFGGNVGLSF